MVCRLLDINKEHIGAAAALGAFSAFCAVVALPTLLPSLLSGSTGLRAMMGARHALDAARMLGAADDWRRPWHGWPRITIWRTDSH
jgi:hypothetical protein